jgi:hypothetical protein
MGGSEEEDINATPFHLTHAPTISVADVFSQLNEELCEYQLYL